MNQTTKKRLPVLSILLTAAVLIALFGFSAQDGPTSGSLSARLTRWLQSMIPFLRGLDWLEGFLRKTAHFTLYAALGFGLTGICDYLTDKKGKRAVGTVASGAFFAALDELHQRFSPGRCGCVTDVLLDTSGVAFGFLVRKLLQMLIRGIKRKKKG